MNIRLFLPIVWLAAFAVSQGKAADAPPPGQYGIEAREVMAYVQKTFWNPKTGIYCRADNDKRPDYIWREAAAFSALVGAARHDPATYRPLLEQHFAGMNSYWDSKAPIAAYEPSPTQGNGHDKYYDDNAWLVITFAEAFRVTADQAILSRANETANFVASGWDEQLGGGIWWHSRHLDDSKNTCSNGPSAVGFLALARLEPKDAPRWTALSVKDVDWTLAHLQARDGLFDDRVIVSTGEVKKGELTYNAALMLRACLGVYHRTGEVKYLKQARRIGEAADGLLSPKTGVYRDPLKWSQFMVEADLSLYRETADAYLLKRATTNADAYYADWKKHPPADMMSNVGIARILWLLADGETDAGRAFWKAEYAPATDPASAK